MKAAVLVLLQLVVVAATAASHSPIVVVPGDVIATGSRQGVNEEGQTYEEGTVLVFGRDGQFKGELAVISQPPLSEPLVWDGIIYVATRYPPGIQRMDLSGHLMSPLTSSVDAVNHLGPGPGRGLLAVNGSCELYQFAADGSLLHFRDALSDPVMCGGVELASDACTVYSVAGGSIVRWNACTHPNAEFLTPSLIPHAFDALRLLPDGTFLVAMANDQPILRLDRQGSIIRNFGLFGKGLALDIDGTSFWTNEFGWITRVDLATGAVLSRTFHGRTWGLAVVGEPRAGLLAQAGSDVPLTTPALIAMIAVLVLLGLHRMR